MENEVNVDALLIEYHKLIKIYSQINELELDIAGIRECLKLEGVNATDVCKLAKAAVKGKEGDLVDKAGEFVELAGILGG